MGKEISDIHTGPDALSAYVLSRLQTQSVQLKMATKKDVLWNVVRRNRPIYNQMQEGESVILHLDGL